MAQTAETENEADAGPGAQKAGVERLCVVTRTVKPVAEMIRFVLGPDGTVVPDLKNKLPGRGVWVSALRDAVAKAAERGGFARGFKRAVQPGADLAQRTEALLERAMLDALGIANKAGLIAFGFGKTEAALEKGAAAALLQAAEAAPDGVRKLAAAARRGAKDEGVTLPVLIFPGEQLDLALGRANVIHAALLAGPATEALLGRYRRLERFRGDEPAKLAEKRE
jgi:predicted RNA-binding protein YlxR (DUF448 family)